MKPVTKTRSPRKTARTTTALSPMPLVSRRDTLRDELLATVDLLKRRRAAEIDEGYIEDYIALHWMEWHGGSLRLTTTGENVCKHLASLLSRASPQPAN
ncbi:MAG: hypothetical protein EKK53_12180 [Burkholderiales bacterium]|nr:MAG: hypothetical protein EKK53_12180 [Burkholderiales bacterium]